MKQKNSHLYGRCGLKPKHSALTKFIRKRGCEDIKLLNNILKRCEINPHVGFLPPELRSLVNVSDIKSVTKKFFAELDFLIYDKYEELKHHTEMKYYLSGIGKLFNTLCVLETYERLPNLEYAYRGWGGAVGDVYKLTFPDIHAEYALKVFNLESGKFDMHGALYEIPIAFCANKCEPKQNVPIYMANLFGAQYMLSKWMGNDYSNPVPEYKETNIFNTTYQERRHENFRNGKRIDFGDTFKTDYGRLSYNGRKMFRKMQNMSKAQINELKSQQKNNFNKSDFQSVYNIFIRWNKKYR